MIRIFNMVRRFFRSVGPVFEALKDRAAGVEIYKKYATQEWAQRHPKTQHDIEAPKVNSSVYIATRAISDAIKSLPVNIVETETIRGVEREIDDNDHPANDLIRNPNPEHTWSEIVDHVGKSYLNDGNAIMTIERMTGPNLNFEVWPRDPRCVDINTKNRSYRFGKFTANQRVYPRNRVIHMRDMDVDDPFWGTGRVNTVREEIMMDYFVNRFNSNFFRYGATLNLMFTPDHDLTEDQHQQILDAMSADVGGADQAFKIFINKYAGKFEFPDQKHKDIAFLDLLKNNREKIFGVHGLPPFRGGVMEYANYANALAQDKDFWLNTIAPIIKVIEDAFNKQLLWPNYGPDIRLRFDLDSVPAIKGDQTDIEDRLLKLKDKGIVSAEYVRQQLNIDEDAAPVVPDALDPDKVEEKPEVSEQEEVENALFKLFKLQREQAVDKAHKMTAGGSLMSVLCNPNTQAPKLYDTVWAAKSLRNNIQPLLRKVLMTRGTEFFEGKGVFDMEHPLLSGLSRHVTFKMEDVIDQNIVMLRAVLDDADRYNWTYRQLEKRIKGVFSYERACSVAKATIADYVSNVVVVLNKIKDEDKNADPLNPAMLTTQQIT